MADTIVNTPSSSDTNTAGWVLAIVAIVAVSLAGFWFVRRGTLPVVPNTGSGSDINITVPGTDVGGGAGTGTDTGAGTTY